MAVAQLRTFDHVDEVPLGARARPLVAETREWAGPAARATEEGRAALTAQADRGVVSYRCALVVVDPDGQRVAEADVIFTERVIGGGRSRLTGTDPSGSLRVRLEADLPPSRLRLNFSFRPATAAAPTDLLPALKLFGALDETRRLGLWSHASGRWAVEPVPIPADHPDLPLAYRSTVEVLARIQDRAGQRFPMPAEISERDAHQIRLADALLRGEAVTGRWQHASLVVDSEGLALIQSASDAHGALVELTSDYSVDIAGYAVLLGPAEHRLRQVRLATTATGGPGERAVAELVPGPNDRYEVRLLGAEAALTGGASVVSPAKLEAYAGQWIAQAGSEILEAGATPRDVIDALTRTGRTGTVWRVPASRTEAETVISTGL